jgi:hypothetical protein
LTQGASPRDRPGSGKYTSIKKCLTWVRLIFARGGKSKKGIGIFPNGQGWIYGEADFIKML